MKRRTFLALSIGSACTLALKAAKPPVAWAQDAVDPFKISLAEWSLNQTLRAGVVTNLDFPRLARREFDIDCIEFVDQFFANKVKDQAYLKDLKQRADDEGVAVGLIMLDTTGNLADADQKKRDRAVERTCEWIDASAFLGGYAVRINARGEGSPDELRDRMIESGLRLAEHAAKCGLSVLIENHGGPSSDPLWLTAVMKGINKPNFGTLPDFGNFPPEIDRYDAVEMILPYAKAVSAKATQFTPDGLVQETDFFRMMRIVRDAGYTRYVGVESGASAADGEPQAICVTRDLLRRIRDEEKRRQPIFNGRDLAGWALVDGGDWTVENGILIGRHGRDWSTDPEKTGSWLRTEREYTDFRLELQYTINTQGNSGVFFRSALEKNPAFTGYEMQIYDAPDTPPTKQGPSSIYDTIAPTENLVRPAGQWNTVTIIAQGPHICIEMNGQRVIDTQLERSLGGYIGLQNHDDHAEVQFRNIRIEEL